MATKLTKSKIGKNKISKKRGLRPAYVVLGILLIMLAGIGIVIYSQASGGYCEGQLFSNTGPLSYISQMPKTACIASYSIWNKDRFSFAGNSAVKRGDGSWHWQNPYNLIQSIKVINAGGLRLGGVELDGHHFGGTLIENNSEKSQAIVRLDKIAQYPNPNGSLPVYAFCFQGTDALRWHNKNSSNDDKYFSKLKYFDPNSGFYVEPYRLYSKYKVQVWQGAKGISDSGWQNADNTSTGDYCAAAKLSSDQINNGTGVEVHLLIDGILDITHFKMYKAIK